MNAAASVPSSPPASLLQMFDNEEYDCRTPQDWLSLGYEKGMPSRKPIPAKALLSVMDQTSSGTTRTMPS